MTMNDSPAAVPPPDATDRGVPGKKERETTSFWRRYARSTGSVVGLAILLLLVVMSIFPELFASTDPNAQDIYHPFSGFGENGHLLGSDQLGRDLYSRLVHGVHVTLGAALLSLGVALVIGVPTGLLAGYRQGRFDQITNAVSDGMMSLPTILAVVAVIAALGPSLTIAMTTVGVFLAPRMFRVQRASTITVCHETYIEAARVVGCRTGRLLFRHVLPNSLSPTIVQATLLFGAGVLAESALSFIGLGVQSPQSSLGSLIADAAPLISQYPFTIVAPGLVTSLCVLSVVLVGEGLKDSLGGRAPIT
ncbi:ABC transporter permease [Pseudonocardia sp. CA-107938]|uniref:ABC transporter permease n=1 Tax=Pseudonocardia sp. CA-107938 TaxID=3240021 RepID=UPI003D8BD516